MKNLFILFLGLLTVSCQSAKSQSEKTLTAHVENIDDGTSVYISEYGEGNKVVALDTLNIKNGKFIFDFPERDYQTLNSIRIDGLDGLVYFINEAKPIELTLLKDEDNFLVNNPDIKAGEANTLFVEYMAFLNETEEKVYLAASEYSAEELLNPAVQQKLRELEKEAGSEITAYRRKAIKDHPNALSSAYILADLFSSKAVSPTKLEEIYESLSEEIKQTFIGQELGHAISPTEPVKIGDIAPDFTARNPQGEPVSLKDILNQKGKYTLIEFWASWCPNCHDEMPNVVEVYNQYHQKGLNIIGVSIDNDKSEWEEAIQEFGMKWPQVSNLNNWQDPIVRKYGVNSIPTNFLLDENGKVIADHLKGKELKEKIKELLD